MPKALVEKTSSSVSRIISIGAASSVYTEITVHWLLPSGVKWKIISKISNIFMLEKLTNYCRNIFMIELPSAKSGLNHERTD